MTDLIQRIEAAKEPRRELFEEAYEVVFGCSFQWDGWYGEKTRGWRFDGMLDAQAWTSAAEMLVPDGWTPASLGSRQDDGTWWAELRKGYYTSYIAVAMPNKRCAHPSLALLSAILRAERKDDHGTVA